MATLTITNDRDFRGEILDLIFGIDTIEFSAAAPAFKSVIFGSEQFGSGAGLIANNVTIKGVVGADGTVFNTMSVRLSTAGSFSAANWNFPDGADDRINLQLVGTGSADTLTGTGFNDTLNGGGSGDTLNGGGGVDTASYNEAPGPVTVVMLDVALNAGIAAGDTYNSIENLFGSSSDDFLAGNNGANRINGSNGNDILVGQGGNDTLLGGDGEDTLSGQNNNDTLDGGANNDTLHGGENDDTLNGGAGNDTLNGDNGNDTINGGANDDVINDGAGDDTINGDAGNDRIVMGDSGVLTGDTFNGGTDTDTFDVSHFTWASNVTIDLTAGTWGFGGNSEPVTNFERIFGANGNAGTLETLIGTSGANIIFGNGGDDLIHDGGGNDIINGGTGNDQIVMDDAQINGDTFNGGTGTDTFDVSHFAWGQNVTIDLAAGAWSFVGGSESVTNFDNILGAGSNSASAVETLIGTSVANTLDGNGGNDVIVGGSGADTMIGDAGDDRFQFSAGPDVVAGETISGGGNTDTIELVGSFFLVDFSLATISSIERLQYAPNSSSATFLGTQLGASGIGAVIGGSFSTLRVNGAVVDLSTVAFTNWGLNDSIRVTGTAGVDSLIGSTQNDTFTSSTGLDTMRGGGGNDTFNVQDVTHVQAGETIDGDDGVDRIILDTLDTVNFTSATVTGIERVLFSQAGSSGVGLVGPTALFTSAQVGTGRINEFSGLNGIDTIVVTGPAIDLSTAVFLQWGTNPPFNGSAVGPDVISLNGTAGADAVTGSSQNDTINGLGGIDTLAGGAGDDRYFVDVANDLVNESAGQGSDTVIASTSYTLNAGAEIELLRTSDPTGTAAINFTGNALRQTLEGNAGSNILNGGGDRDTMRGLRGNDSYVVDNAADIVVEEAGPGEGTDNVNASVSYTLAADVSAETLRTTDAAGTTAINLVGNNIANFVTGNDGGNILIGGGSVDTLTGNGGNDSYFVDLAADRIVEVDLEGTDNVNTSVSYALEAGDSIETLRTDNAAGTTAIDLTGNEINNFVTGNNGANRINGRLGNDTLRGNGGADIFVFNTALNAATNVDTIADFQVGVDEFLLENSGIFTGVVAGTLNEDAFHIGAAAADAEDRIIYNSATGVLSFDADGNGSGVAIRFAQVSAGLALTNADFVAV